MPTPRDALCLVTCAKVPGLTGDDQLLQRALADDGWSVAIATWDDPEVDWAGFAAVILRSTWDYHLRPAEFRAWLARCQATGVRLFNPAALVEWNLHKGYLGELARSGLRVVPTAEIRRGEAGDLPRLLSERGWSEAVVKPAISATAYRTFRTSADTAASDGERLRGYLADADFLVQPFVPEIASHGEISFVFFAGELSHATLKQARPGDFRVQQDFGGSMVLCSPSEDLQAQARRIAAAIREPWLYARIDGVDCGGDFVVMEVELVEPQLFFGLAPGAANAMATALRRLVESDVSTP